MFSTLRTDGSINTSGVSIANANGVRVALETTNPHTGANAATAMISRVFLMPLLNLFGHDVDNTAEHKRERGCGDKGRSRASDRY